METNTNPDPEHLTSMTRVQDLEILDSIFAAIACGGIPVSPFTLSPAKREWPQTPSTTGSISSGPQQVLTQPAHGLPFMICPNQNSRVKCPPHRIQARAGRHPVHGHDPINVNSTGDLVQTLSGTLPPSFCIDPQLGMSCMFMSASTMTKSLSSVITTSGTTTTGPTTSIDTLKSPNRSSTATSIISTAMPSSTPSSTVMTSSCNNLTTGTPAQSPGQSSLAAIRTLLRILRKRDAAGIGIRDSVSRSGGVGMPGGLGTATYSAPLRAQRKLPINLTGNNSTSSSSGLPSIENKGTVNTGSPVSSIGVGSPLISRALGTPGRAAISILKKEFEPSNEESSWQSCSSNGRAGSSTLSATLETSDIGNSPPSLPNRNIDNNSCVKISRMTSRSKAKDVDKSKGRTKDSAGPRKNPRKQQLARSDSTPEISSHGKRCKRREPPLGPAASVGKRDTKLSGGTPLPGGTPTIKDLANQSNIHQRVNGWKLRHLSESLDAVAESEREMGEEFNMVLSKMDEIMSLRLSDTNKQNLNQLEDLLKGNSQKCKTVLDHLTESRSQVEKILDHQPYVTNVINQYRHQQTPE